MSLPGEPIFDIPELTVEIARAAFSSGNIYMQMRVELGVFYDDKQFTGLFFHTCQPAIAPWRLALVTVMQFAENLTDRQAAEARIDCKYANLSTHDKWRGCQSGAWRVASSDVGKNTRAG